MGPGDASRMAGTHGARHRLGGLLAADMPLEGKPVLVHGDQLWEPTFRKGQVVAAVVAGLYSGYDDALRHDGRALAKRNIAARLRLPVEVALDLQRVEDDRNESTPPGNRQRQIGHLLVIEEGSDRGVELIGQSVGEGRFRECEHLPLPIADAAEVAPSQRVELGLSDAFFARHLLVLLPLVGGIVEDREVQNHQFPVAPGKLCVAAQRVAHPRDVAQGSGAVGERLKEVD